MKIVKNEKTNDNYKIFNNLESDENFKQYLALAEKIYKRISKIQKE